MILPCVKRTKKPREQKLIGDVAKNNAPNGNVPTTSNVISNTDEEKRREVALEALKLSEQRRLRGSLIAPIEENENSRSNRNRSNDNDNIEVVVVGPQKYIDY